MIEDMLLWLLVLINSYHRSNQTQIVQLPSGQISIQPQIPLFRTMYIKKTAISLFSLVLLASPAFSTICWGNDFFDEFGNGPWNAAYIGGSLGRSGAVIPTTINAQGNNPCDATFDIDDSGYHSGYQLAGCNTDSMWLNQNGQFHSSCIPQAEKVCWESNLFNTGCGDTVSQLYCC
jgi:hypothetical protein